MGSVTGTYEHSIDAKGRLFIPVKCVPDSQGRIILPQRLRKYADLGKDVVIIGVHDRAEIWSAERWNAEEEEMTPEKMAALMYSLEL